MVPTVHKPVHVQTKQQNVTKLQQLFLQQKFISFVRLMNKLILSITNNEKSRPTYKKNTHESNFPVVKWNKVQFTQF